MRFLLGLLATFSTLGASFFFKAARPSENDNNDHVDASIVGANEEEACLAGARWTIYRNKGARTNGEEVELNGEDARMLADIVTPHALAAFFAAKLGLSEVECNPQSLLLTSQPKSESSNPRLRPGGLAAQERCALYDATAGRLSSCHDLHPTVTTGSSSSPPSSPPSSGDSGALRAAPLLLLLEAWLVPPDRWFVFPSDELGRTVAVPRVAPPRGNNQPILLETISNAPRVFHIHNFLSNAEAESLVAYSEANRDPVYGLHRSTPGVEHQVKLITFVRRK